MSGGRPVDLRDPEVDFRAKTPENRPENFTKNSCIKNPGVIGRPIPRNCHEMALELVSGADFWCKLMSGGRPVDLGGLGVDFLAKTKENLPF